MRYDRLVIKTFAEKDTARLFNRERVRQFHSIEKAARKALVQLHHATSLRDLAAIPGNRLEKLPEHAGKYSVRINDQFRILFEWRTPDAYDVEITDYH